MPNEYEEPDRPERLVGLPPLESEHAERLVWAAIHEVEHAESGLDLARLTQVIVAGDLEAVAADLAPALLEAVPATGGRRPGGLLAAAHLRHNDVLLCHTAFLGLIGSPEPGESEAAIQFLHHELCRVHEFTVRGPGEANVAPVVSATHQFLRPMVQGLWEAYFSARRSRSGHPPHTDSHIGLIPVLLVQTHQDLSLLLAELHARAIGTTTFLATVEVLLESFLRHCGLALGALAAAGLSLVDVDARAARSVERSYLAGEWGWWGRGLGALYQSVGHWRAADTFLPFYESVTRILRQVGCDIIEHADGGIWVHSPNG